MRVKGGVETPADPVAKDALIASLLERVEALMAHNAALVAGGGTGSKARRAAQDAGQLEPTNNTSERVPRPCAVYRKITNGFRSERGAHRYADIRSVIETARRRSVRPIDAIRLTRQGAPIPAMA